MRARGARGLRALGGFLLAGAVLALGAAGGAAGAGRGLVEAEGGEFQAALAFLQAHLPPGEAERLPEGYLEGNVYAALQARAATPWASAVPWDVFLNYVLPPWSVDEHRDDWRAFFLVTLLPFVEGSASLEEAAQFVNQHVWTLPQFGGNITFLANQTPEIMSPFQVIEAQHASCTGLSIFLVDALRAVGIPARLAGTPKWVTAPFPGGNHDWAEVLLPEGWSFADGGEPSPLGFNHTWFYPKPADGQIPGGSNHSIFAVSYAPGAETVTFPLAWNWENTDVHGFDVTEHYLPPAGATS